MAAEVARVHMLQSNAEDNYVMASANMVELKSQSNEFPKAPITTEAINALLIENDTPPAASAEIKNEVTAESKLKDLSLADLTKSLPVHIEPESQDPRWNHLPQTSTAFAMPEELFRKAKEAQPGETGSFWSHTLYRKQPDLKSKPLVHYCRSVHTTERVLKTYFAEQKLLGFDLEWKSDAHKNSGPKANVSLIQLASEDRIVLIHLALFPKGDGIGELVAPTLKKIMEDPEITKLGVSIKADCTRVRKWLGINCKGLFELSHLYKLVKFSETKEFGMINKTLVSLARQVQEHLHLPMFKGQDVRSSDWSKPISMSQLLYAAGDSYAAVQLYHTMELKRKALDPMPPRPYNADQGLPIRFAEGVEISTEGETEEVEPELSNVKRKYTKKANASKETAAEVDHVTMEDPDADHVQSSSDSKENESSSSSYSTGSVSSSSEDQLPR